VSRGTWENEQSKRLARRKEKEDLSVIFGPLKSRAHEKTHGTRFLVRGLAKDGLDI